MDKFEYSDLYKFLVPAGIVLIGLSILAPWFYLKEPFDLLVEQQKIALLTEQAQKVLRSRQDLIGRAYSIVPWVSIALFALGVISIAYGLFKWFAKQTDIDKRDRLTTQKLENEVKGMTPKEIEEKTEQEFKEAIVNETASSSTTTTTTTRNEFFIRYLQIEQFLTNRITKHFQNKFRILANHRVERFDYDLILSAMSPHDDDVIFEFKYLPNGINVGNVEKTLSRLQLSTNAYAEKVKSNTIPVLLITVPETFYKKINVGALKTFYRLAANMNIRKIKIEILAAERLEERSNDFLNELIK